MFYCDVSCVFYTKKESMTSLLMNWFLMLLILLHLMTNSVDSLLCNHSNESCRAVLSCGTVDCAVQCGSNFLVCGWNPSVWPCMHAFKWKLLSSTFMWYCLLCCTICRVLSFNFVAEILVCIHSNEGYWAVLSSSAVSYAEQCGSNLSIWMKLVYDR